MADRSGGFTVRDYSRLRGLTGITDEQIEVHLELYEGYVKRSNALLQEISGLSGQGRGETPAFAEQTRRLGWELNGMRLHELYFDGLRPGGSGHLEPGSALGEAVERQYGGVDAWMAELMAVAKLPGVGWAVAYADPVTRHIANLWMEQHHAGHPAGWKPIVVLDAWEHAFSVYLKPTERARYLDDFFANVDWQVASSRLEEMGVQRPPRRPGQTGRAGGGSASK